MSNLYLTTPINVPLGTDVCNVQERLARHLGVKASDLANVALHKQSIDARDKGDVHFVCSYVVECKKQLKNATPYVAPADILQTAQKDACGSCIVVGAGPSGLFLALYLAKRGVKVTVVEQGSDVDKRKQAVQRFFDGGEFSEKCNVQFGLGGAGTFSDGKLTTGTSSPLVHTVFNQFVKSGAPREILTQALPHVGTDKLTQVVADMRDEICRLGGTFLFDTEVSDIIIQNGAARGVVAESGGKSQNIQADCVALCIGHSARKMFHTLVKHGVDMQFKPFAVGLRIEHPRTFINQAQYGKLFATHRDLGAATYKLTANVDGRACYSFCMCPGGYVVPANSEVDTVVVNGMSNFARDAQNSNSALVVSVGAQDVGNYGFGSGVLSGVKFQQSLEKQAFVLGGGNYKAPCQNVTDFLQGKTSAALQQTSYFRGVTPCNFANLLPPDIYKTLCGALLQFNKKIKGFAECGVLTGVETRTSSPVKILRDENMQSNIANLYPVGEGAGHSGGIVTSAVDGLKVALAIADKLKA